MPDTTFATPGGDLRGYLAVPSAPGPRPGVIVVHEAFGLTEDIRRWADRFAAEGYLALAPDLFAWGPTLRCLVAAFRALRAGHGRALDDIEAARQHLAGQENANGRVGIIGFCMGGGFALLAAPGGAFHASAVNYGELPRNPDDVLAEACPIVASYGARDRFLAGSAERLRRALSGAGVAHDVKEYADAGHSFLNQHTGWMAATDRVLAPFLGSGHHPAAADDAWQRICSFFDRHLGSGAG